MSPQQSEAVERRLYNALWWAKVQSAGPIEIDPDTPAVAGLTRAVAPDGDKVWLVPTMPSGAGHGVLEELGAPPVAVEQPNETARLLAICVTCCWTDRSAPAWPGATGTLAQIRSVYAGMRGRREQPSDLTLIIGSLRRLHATQWIRWDEKVAEVRLGPRVVTWTPTDLSTLRDLCRHLPDPPPATLTTRPTPPPADALPDPTEPNSSTEPPTAEPSAVLSATELGVQPGLGVEGVSEVDDE
ncbi:hypothetical protein [Kribbella solani]|uniref:Uncharacterized protein n=2 Tax=Kribbella solani TaxID=236067 RepID=A0A841DK53_9ACTN|nr:hypothetical protein [Kribbella solani]MBB5977156.1 hypothetical protein [Kribbella solani]